MNLISLFLIILLLAGIIAIIPYVLAILLFIGAVFLIYKLVLKIKKKRYFKSDEFLAHKKEAESIVFEYNEIANYIKSIPNRNQFIAPKKELEHAHLANFINTSNHNYARNRNQRNLVSSNVYPASLQVVRRASEEPIKYLCKYFNIKPTEENLEQIEEIGTNISKIKNTINNLNIRQQQIENSLNPPKFITKHFYNEFLDQVGVNLPKIKPEYAHYIFEYVSAGGNSSQRTVIKLDGETTEAIASYLAEKIKFNKSAEGQRALMTNRLRTMIKKRDNYTCQMCSASVAEQSLLLLEIDHIIPISKGGMTTVENLQTLCWKCNRSKSNKILD